LNGEWESLFPYYAGFSKEFADWLIEKFALPAKSTVFDPWNGAGTTTIAAAHKGLRSFGYDLNPAMAIVAKARAVSRDSADLLLPLAELLLEKATAKCPMGDPLTEWFDPDSAAVIRSIALSIKKNASGGLKRLGIEGQQVSGPTAVMYVALFAACRSALGPLRSSNPTWVRAAKSDSDRISITRDLLAREFKTAVLSATRHAYDHGLSDEKSIPQIHVHDAAAPSRTRADFILTSPPYCTRIDYAHLTKVELAILDETLHDHYRRLRCSLTGTALTGTAPRRRPRNLGAKCNAFLDEVRSHPSRASQGYYYKSHLDYYAKMARSVKQVCKCLMPGGRMALVIQDSWYKDVHNDVPGILAEFCADQGLETLDRKDFLVRRSLADVHKYRASYKEDRPTAETVLLLGRMRAA
jgi:hypothetical protein